jgi:hypothetical protein
VDAEVKPPPNVLLSGVNGSTAYGLATEDSDVDRIGRHAAPTSQFHGLHLPIGKAATWVGTKPDATFHEAGNVGRGTVQELPPAEAAADKNGGKTDESHRRPGRRSAGVG